LLRLDVFSWLPEKQQFVSFQIMPFGSETQLCASFQLNTIEYYRRHFKMLKNTGSANWSQAPGQHGHSQMLAFCGLFITSLYVTRSFGVWSHPSGYLTFPAGFGAALRGI